MYLLRLWLLISTYNQTIVRILEWKVKSNDNSILLSWAQHVICNMRQKLDLSQDFTLNNSDSNLNTKYAMTLFTLFNPVKSHSMTGGFQTSIQILQHSSLGWICSNFSFMFNCWFSTCKTWKTLDFSSSLFICHFLIPHHYSLTFLG